MDDLVVEPATDRFGFLVPAGTPLPAAEQREALVRENRRLVKWAAMRGSDEYAALSPERRGSLSAARAAQLERRVYKGVPDAVRGLVWQALGGSQGWEGHRYHELRTQALSDSSGLDPAVVDQIELDLHRTFPTNVLWLPPRPPAPVDRVVASLEAMVEASGGGGEGGGGGESGGGESGGGGEGRGDGGGGCGKAEVAGPSAGTAKAATAKAASSQASAPAADVELPAAAPSATAPVDTAAPAADTLSNAAAAAAAPATAAPAAAPAAEPPKKKPRTARSERAPYVPPGARARQK